MRKLYFLIFIAFLSLPAGAQSFIRFTDTAYALNIAPGDTTSLRDSVYNTDSLAYYGTLYIGARMQNAVKDTVFPSPIDSVFFAQDSLPGLGSPGTARALHIPIDVTYPALTSGPNLIVIWPIYTSPSSGHIVPIGPGDSVHINISVHNVGIEEVPLAKIYIIQRSSTLNIQFGDMGNIVQQVSLYDLEGRLSYTGSADQAHSISTAGWSAGVYFCRISTYQGEQRTIRFILQP